MRPLSIRDERMAGAFFIGPTEGQFSGRRSAGERSIADPHHADSWVYGISAGKWQTPQGDLLWQLKKKMWKRLE